jgi:hypothetical protein
VYLISSLVNFAQSDNFNVMISFIKES